MHFLPTVPPAASQTHFPPQVFVSSFLAGVAKSPPPSSSLPIPPFSPLPPLSVSPSLRCWLQAWEGRGKGKGKGTAMACTKRSRGERKRSQIAGYRYSGAESEAPLNISIPKELSLSLLPLVYAEDKRGKRGPSERGPYFFPFLGAYRISPSRGPRWRKGCCGASARGWRRQCCCCC